MKSLKMVVGEPHDHGRGLFVGRSADRRHGAQSCQQRHSNSGIHRLKPACFLSDNTN